MFFKIFGYLTLIQIIQCFSDNKQDEINLNALLNIITSMPLSLTVYYRNYECNKCRLTSLYTNLKPQDNVTVQIKTFYPTYYIYVANSETGGFYCDEFSSQPFQFGESGAYLLRIQNSSPSLNCSIETVVKVDLLYEPVYIAIGVFGGAALLYIIAKYLYKKKRSRDVNSDLGVPIQLNASTYLIDEPSLNSNLNSYGKPMNEKTRMKSVDVFRGFSLAIVIFANYGAGGYSSLDHAVWNGLHLADTVFPCFVFILGISIPLSLKSIGNKMLMNNDTKRKRILSILFKIVKRSILLFFFGLVTSNSDYYLKDIRIMGVLQRFSISYFVCACIELIYLSINNFKYLDTSDVDFSLQPSKLIVFRKHLKELFYYPIQWFIIVFIALVWVFLTLFIEVGFCSAGYLGPGGLHDNGTHFNCTGGAANYIDRLILGEKHMYQNPTSKVIFEHTLPHDPEGLLGCLTSICLAYLGVQCGHILIHYQAPYKRIIHFISYSFIYGMIGAVLCKVSKDDGWIPINKNLWSLSFIFAMAGIAFFILCVFYALIDVFDIYSGTPFLYFGRNSITIYICHTIFASNFPFFLVKNTHPYLLGEDLYGVCMWLIVAYIMDYKKVYISL